MEGEADGGNISAEPRGGAEKRVMMGITCSGYEG